MPRLWITLASLLLVVGLLLSSGRADVRGDRADLESPSAVGEVLARLTTPAAGLSDETLSTRLAADVVDRLESLGIVRLRLRNGETIEKAVARLERTPLVASAEPNLLLRSSVIPNDPFYTAQSSYLGLIHAPAGWDIELGNDSVLVAVLDSGVQIEHPDLLGQIWTNPYEIEANFTDDDNNGCVDDLHGCSFVSTGSADPECETPLSGNVDDDNGHGTFVAGIIAAAGNNSLGITGVAPGVRILPVKILDCKGGGTAMDASQAILYAARQGARVANISFGADGESQTLTNAMREAHDRYGMVIIAATGNEGVARRELPCSAALHLRRSLVRHCYGRKRALPVQRLGPGGQIRRAGPEHRQHAAPPLLRTGLALRHGRALRHRQWHVLRGAARIGARRAGCVEVPEPQPGRRARHHRLDRRGPAGRRGSQLGRRRPGTRCRGPRLEALLDWHRRA